MATYIALINWTDQGVQDYQDSPARADAFATMLEGLGGKVHSLYWTIGPYDMVLVWGDAAACGGGLGGWW